MKLKEHLKDGNGDYKSSVIQKLNKKIKPTSSESQTYQNRIEQLERSIQNEENVISQCEQDMIQTLLLFHEAMKSNRKNFAAGKINSYRQNIDSFRKQLELLEKQDAQNKPYYLAIEYAKAVYFRAAQDVDRAEKPTLRELNEIIAENFERMFNSKEKYACLEKDYKIHMYYRSMSGLSDIEEKNLSVGEMIAVNIRSKFSAMISFNSLKVGFSALSTSCAALK